MDDLEWFGYLYEFLLRGGLARVAVVYLIIGVVCGAGPFVVGKNLIRQNDEQQVFLGAAFSGAWPQMGTSRS